MVLTQRGLSFADVVATALLTVDADAISKQISNDSASELESDSSSLSTKSTSGRVNSFDESESQRRKYNFLQSFDEAVSIIDDLFDISIFIRGASSSSFRQGKAALYVERDEHGNDMIAQFRSLVEKKIELFCREADTPLWLQERLTKLVTLRRQQFYYQKAHIRHLAEKKPLSESEDKQVISAPERPRLTPEHVSESTPRPASAPSPAVWPILAADPKTIYSGSSKNTKGTSATELVLDRPVKPSNHGRVAPSEKRIREKIFPDPPREPRDKPFECNQCFYIQPSKTREENTWRYIKFLFVI
jgi:hypothetical protein